MTRPDTRATSITVTYTMTVAISAVLIMGLLVSAGGLVDRQRERVTQLQFEDIGTEVTSELVSVDQFVTATGDDSVSNRLTLPTHVAGNPYDLLLATSGATATLTIASGAGSPSVTFDLEPRTDVCPTAVDGGAVLVRYDTTNDCLTLEDD
jgi:hypothetical protein